MRSLFSKKSKDDALMDEDRSDRSSVVSNNLTKSLVEIPRTKNKANLNIKNLTIYDKSSYKKQGNCLVCFRIFTQTFRQHHCRICASAVCGDCSLGTINQQRACDVCYLKYLNEFDEERKSKILQTLETLCGYLLHKKAIKMEQLEQLKSKTGSQKQPNEQKQKQNQDATIKNLQYEALQLQERKKLILNQLSNIIEQNKKLQQEIIALQKEQQ